MEVIVEGVTYEIDEKDYQTLVGGKEKMTEEKNIEEEEKKEYKNKVVFLRKSKVGYHLFIYDSREDLVAGATLIMRVDEVERLIGGGTDWIKVSVVPPKTVSE